MFLIGYVIYKEKSKALNIIYFVLGTLISLFNYLFKTGVWYIYLIMIMPVVVIILSKREKNNAVFLIIMKNLDSKLRILKYKHQDVNFNFL
ncbi:MAG: hypothetical protein L6V78_07435 [Clostridium sp.]|nr:MAG: hypothetical protein L6V78_07435 [Clostridium sp.]